MPTLKEYLQILVPLIPVLFSLLTKLREGRRAAAAAHQPGAGGTADDWDLMELSFLLLFASLTSLLLADSLLISGRIVLPGPAILIESALIAALIVGALVAAYRAGFNVAAIGAFSSATLLALLLAPGGPFLEPLQDGAESAPDLMLPAVMFLTLASVSLFYESGGILASTATPERIISLGLIGALTLLASLGLGVQFVGRIERDSSIPKLSADGRQLQTAIRQTTGSPGAKKLIYQLISERQLASTYEAASVEIGVQRAKMLKLQKEPVVESTVSSSLTENQESEYTATRRRLETIDAIDMEIARLDVSEQAAYAQGRLGFAHALGGLDDRRAPAAIPGRNAVNRYEMTAMYRQLSLIPQLPQSRAFAETWASDYDMRVHSRLLFPKLTETVAKAPVLTLPSYSDTLFPAMPQGADAQLLQRQLILPAREDSVLAYNLYRRLARAKLRDELGVRLANAADAAKFEEALDAIDAVPIAARRAFGHYVTSTQGAWTTDALLAMLADLADAETEPLRIARNVVLVDRLLNGLRATEPCTVEDVPPTLQPLCTQIAAKSPATRTAFLSVVGQREVKAPVADLLHPDLTAAIRRLYGPFTPGGSSVPQYIVNPVAVGLQNVLERSTLDGPNRDLVGQGWRLEPQQAESQLLLLAWSLYQGGGEYAPAALTQAIVDAGFSGAGLQRVVAAAFYLPLFVGSVIIGDLIARRLAARRSVLALIETEMKAAKDKPSVPEGSIELIGRKDVLERLESLARRGWATIAIAGRRGVGKSRLLQGLRQKYDEPGEGKGRSIAVWIVSPARFDEHEFVEDALERLATSTEAAIADKVDAKPLNIRDTEQRLSQAGAIVMGVSLIAFAFLCWSVSRLGRPELAMSWIPAGMLLMVSLGMLSVHFRRQQPIDLSGWIERERDDSPHLVWLYRDTVKALRFVAERKVSGSGVHIWQDKSNPVVVGVTTLLAFMFFLMSMALMLDPEESDDRYAALYLLFIAILCLAPLISNLRSRARSRRYGQQAGTSLMQLIQQYRKYAETVVRRLEEGALGVKSEFSPVVVCIDELDKIVGLRETRQFLRRIKSIFEIRGVSYYLSISEDALSALTLGTSLGKNEVDSAFDHIVTVPGLDVVHGDLLATTYTAGLPGEPQLPARVGRMIAAMSFGIPRDIRRRCDELRDPAGTSATQVVEAWLLSQLDIGFTASLLSEDAYQALREPKGRMTTIDKLLKTPDLKEPNVRFLLLIATLALLFHAAELGEEQWRSRSAELSAFGYSLPVRPIDELRTGFGRLVDQHLSASSSSAPAAAAASGSA